MMSRKLYLLLNIAHRAFQFCKRNSSAVTVTACVLWCVFYTHYVSNNPKFLGNSDAPTAVEYDRNIDVIPSKKADNTVHGVVYPSEPAKPVVPACSSIPRSEYEAERNKRYTKPAKPEQVALMYWDGKTKLDKDVLHKHINEVMRTLPHLKNTAAFHQLLFETTLAETDRGLYSTNCKTSADLGLFQMRLKTTKETLEWLRSQHPDVFKTVETFRDKKLSLQENLERNITYSTAVAATYYWRRSPAPIIDTTTHRGELWKKEYNSRLGKGTVGHYVRQVKNDK